MNIYCKSCAVRINGSMIDHYMKEHPMVVREFKLKENI